MTTGRVTMISNCLTSRPAQRTVSALTTGGTAQLWPKLGPTDVRVLNPGARHARCGNLPDSSSGSATGLRALAYRGRQTAKEATDAGNPLREGRISW